MDLAFVFTGVLALLAEAVHTLSDILVSAFLLVAVRSAGEIRTPSTLFEHGRAENVAALVAATPFLSFTSYQLLMEALPRLFTTGTRGWLLFPLASRLGSSSADHARLGRRTGFKRGPRPACR